MGNIEGELAVLRGALEKIIAFNGHDSDGWYVPSPLTWVQGIASTALASCAEKDQLNTDHRVGWMQRRVEMVERRQRGGGMTVRVADMRYLLDRIVALESHLRDALPFLAHVQCATMREGDALAELEGRIATAVGAGADA